jgi:hypothetical protein
MNRRDTKNVSTGELMYRCHCKKRIDLGNCTKADCDAHGPYCAMAFNAAKNIFEATRLVRCDEDNT